MGSTYPQDRNTSFLSLDLGMTTGWYLDNPDPFPSKPHSCNISFHPLPFHPIKLGYPIWTTTDFQNAGILFSISCSFSNSGRQQSTTVYRFSNPTNFIIAGSDLQPKKILETETIAQDTSWLPVQNEVDRRWFGWVDGFRFNLPPRIGLHTSRMRCLVKFRIYSRN